MTLFDNYNLIQYNKNIVKAYVFTIIKGEINERN